MRHLTKKVVVSRMNQGRGFAITGPRIALAVNGPMALVYFEYYPVVTITIREREGCL